MQALRYTIILQSEPEGGFTITVPALPGCITYGKNLQEAKQMAVDAIRAYLASLKKHKEPIPTEQSSFVTSVELKTAVKKRVPAYV